MPVAKARIKKPINMFERPRDLPAISEKCTARRGEYVLLLGNSLGSVLMQGSFILGFLALISPIPLTTKEIVPLVPLILIALGMILFGVVKKGKLGKTEGASLIALYISYLLYHVYLISIA